MSSQQVMNRPRGGHLELSGAGVQGVADPGDSSASKSCAGVGVCLQHLGGVLGCNQGPAVDVDDADLLLARVEGDDAVQEVLGRHRVGDPVGAVGDADDAPLAGLGCYGKGGVDGGVGAVEAAEAEVDDAGGLGRARADEVPAGSVGRFSWVMFVTNPGRSRPCGEPPEGRPSHRGGS